MTGDGYAGDVTSVEAMEILRNTAGAVLLDVRTDAEWTFVGRPDLSSLGREPVLISWQTFPGMAPNGGFVEAVRRSIQAKDVPVLVMCRSGQRPTLSSTSRVRLRHPRALALPRNSWARRESS